MRIEESIFARRRPDTKRLLKYGFRRVSGGLAYAEDFMDGFCAEIHVKDDGGVTARVIDLDTGEAYDAVNGDAYLGSFVSAVRDRYRAVLQKISDQCFDRTKFVWPQSNRIAARIKAAFGDDPDYPFKKARNFGVFRHADSRRWYGIVMDIPRSKLTGSMQDDDVIEAINIKIDPSRRDEIMSMNGVYPAYHMNRKGWVSVIMDDSVPDDEMIELISTSRSMTARAKQSP